MKTELQQLKENGREEAEISPEVIADLAELKKAHAELKLTTSLRENGNLQEIMGGSS